MKCSALLLISAMSVLPMLGEDTYIYQYDAAGNCIGRLLSTSATLAAHKSQQQKEAAVEVFPLETDGEFFIFLDSTTGEENSFTMSSIDGTRTSSGKITEDITGVDISSFKSGIYSLGVTYAGNLYSFKIIKK